MADTDKPVEPVKQPWWKRVVAAAAEAIGNVLYSGPR